MFPFFRRFKAQDAPGLFQAVLAVAFVAEHIEFLEIVGYGLDLDGFYRNLPYVAQVQNMN